MDQRDSSAQSGKDVRILSVLVSKLVSSGERTLLDDGLHAVEVRAASTEQLLETCQSTTLLSFCTSTTRRLGQSLDLLNNAMIGTYLAAAAGAAAAGLAAAADLPVAPVAAPAAPAL